MNALGPLRVVIMIIGMSLPTCAQTNFYELVTQMWLVGQKTNVLQIAQQRLGENSNDIAGLLIELEYQIEFLDTEAITNTATRVIDVGSAITTPNFASRFPWLQAGMGIITNVLNDLTPAEIIEERAKGSITNKMMSYGPYIKALQDDGYFQ